MAQLTGSRQVFHSDTSVVDTSQQIALGNRGYDPSGNEYIYLQGVGSTTAGNWVVYDEDYATTLLVANEVGPVAIAMAVVDATTEYGWYQIYGKNTIAKTDTIAADKPLYIDGTAGRADDAGVAGDIIVGAYSMSADTSNVATVMLNYPHVSDELGGSGGSIGGSDTQVQFNDGGTLGGDAGLTWNKTTDALKIGVAGTTTGTLQLTGATSGTLTLTANAVAGTVTVTLPAATDTLMGKATTDTLTNKTFDTAGAGNSFSINGLAATANTGTGDVVRATSPTLVTPTLGAATATSINNLTITSSTGTLTIAAGKTVTVNNTLTLAGTDGTTMTFPSTTATIARTDAGQTFTGVNTFTSPKIITDVSDTNGNEIFKITATGSAVNEITIANAATGNPPIISATGSDTNIGITLTPKGTGIVKGELKRFMVRLLGSTTDQTVTAALGGDYRISNRAITVKAVGAYVDTAGTTGTCDIDINEAGTTILSTKITLDSTEKSSETAATPPVISDSAIAADAIVTFDLDVIHTTAAKGLTVWIDYVYA